MSQQPNKPKHYGRRLFIAAAIIAAAFLLLVFRSCMQDAQMSLGGFSSFTDTTVATKIINQKLYTPSSDSLLTMSQIQFELDILRALDSADNNATPPAERAASMFNRHVKSVSEYNWIRMMTLSSLKSSVGNEEWNEMTVDASMKKRLRVYLDSVSVPHIHDSIVAANEARLRLFLPVFVLRTGVLTSRFE